MKTLLLVKDYLKKIALTLELTFVFIDIMNHPCQILIMFTSPYYNVHIVKFLRNPKVENNNIYILIKRNST